MFYKGTMDKKKWYCYEAALEILKKNTCSILVKWRIELGQIRTYHGLDLKGSKDNINIKLAAMDNCYLFCHVGSM